MRKIKSVLFFSVIILIGAYYLFIKTNSRRAVKTGLDIGNKAPVFSYTTIDEKKVNSQDLKGKVIVLTSSAAWCPTCVMEARQFSVVYPKYKNKDVVFISVDIDPRDSIEAIRKLQITTNTPWDYANKQGGQDIIDKFRLDRFEKTYLIDKKGIIVFKDNVITDSKDLEKELSSLNL